MFLGEGCVGPLNTDKGLLTSANRRPLSFAVAPLFSPHKPGRTRASAGQHLFDRTSLGCDFYPVQVFNVAFAKGIGVIAWQALDTSVCSRNFCA